MTKEARDLLRAIAEERRHQREAAHNFVKAILTSNREALAAAIHELGGSSDGWTLAFRLCAKLSSAPADMKSALLLLWLQLGDHIRSEVQDDTALTKALRVLLPSYDGPGLTLFRGDTAYNRRRRTYGLSWTASRDVAEQYASGSLWRSRQGGSVLICAEVPPEAIICAPALISTDLNYAEQEYLVDRRYLRRVAVLKHWSSSSNRAECDDERLAAMRSSLAELSDA